MTDIRGGIECNIGGHLQDSCQRLLHHLRSGRVGNRERLQNRAEIEKAGGYSVLNHVGDWVDSGRFPQRSHWNVYIAYFAGIFIDCPTASAWEIVNCCGQSDRGDRALWMSCAGVVYPQGQKYLGFCRRRLRKAQRGRQIV